VKPIERFGIVAAMSTNRVIGMDGGIPWRLPEDRKLFKSLTNQGILIIGKRTFDEHPNLAHVNHTKYCIVVSNSTKSLDDDKNNAPNTMLKLVKSLPDALSLAKELDESLEKKIDDDCDLQCWVAGGERMYLEALQHPSAAEIHLSVVDREISLTQGKDLALFPSKYRWDHKFEEASETAYPGTDTFPSFTYFVYKRNKRRF
jgi:dihydrofolate reductase